MTWKILALLTCFFFLASCGGTRTFHDYARAGDTVAIPVGIQPTFNKDNITVTITPSSGVPIILSATNPSIRAIINLYPDPISNMIVSREINEDITPAASTYGYQTLIRANNDKDYYETTVFIDLPLSLPTGVATIKVSDNNSISHSATLNIIDGAGTANTFDSDITGTSASFPLSEEMLDSLSRSTHTEVTFSAATIPNAIEIYFTHDPDSTAGGNGKALVVNPLGYKKNLFWNDDGTNLKVILMGNKTDTVDDIKDYKFYVAGTATNLQLQTVNSFDVNGNALTGTNAILTTN